jgi:Type II secretion system (T2SS), protein M subtype b
MRSDFRLRRNVILGVVGALLVADAAMGVYSMEMASTKLSPQQELAEQTTQVKLLKADVERAAAIQQDLPKIKADCERFEGSLPPAGGGYSVISSELAQLAREAGLQISTLGFHGKELVGKGMTEVTVDATVAGDYKSVVHFLNGLQRSANYYVVESLTLGTDTVAAGAPHGSVKVVLHLKSYFKNGA